MAAKACSDPETLEGFTLFVCEALLLHLYLCMRLGQGEGLSITKLIACS